MLQGTSNAEAVREPVLNPVDRITERLFGLLMALSFVGAISVVPNTLLWPCKADAAPLDGALRATPNTWPIADRTAQPAITGA